MLPEVGPSLTSKTNSQLSARACVLCSPWEDIKAFLGLQQQLGSGSVAEAFLLMRKCLPSSLRSLVSLCQDNFSNPSLGAKVSKGFSLCRLSVITCSSFTCAQGKGGDGSGWVLLLPSSQHPTDPQEQQGEPLAPPTVTRTRSKGVME